MSSCGSRLKVRDWCHYQPFEVTADYAQSAVERELELVLQLASLLWRLRRRQP
jgi:hypothetical protein